MEMRGVINCSLLKTGGTSGRRYLSSRPSKGGKKGSVYNLLQ